MHSKIDRLQSIYASFEEQAAEYKADAACRRGCAFCCTDAGRIDITTLEGLAIAQTLGKLAGPQQTAAQKALVKDCKRREQGLGSPCPLLMKNRACMIYPVRPFACRRIYSLKTCDPKQPPILNRKVMEIGGEFIRALQQLDDTGYTGHLSFILRMLEAPGFANTYLAGKFKPEEVVHFGKSHQIVINRMVAGKCRSNETPP